MTIVNDIQVGDLVGATSKTNPDDQAQFRVTDNTPGGLESENNYFSEKSWTFKTLEKAKRPLPTQDGLYGIKFSRHAETPAPYTRLFRLYSGEWSQVSDDSLTHDDLVRLFDETGWDLVRLVFEKKDKED